VRRDVLAHPGPTDLAGDTSRIFRGGEREDEDEVPVVDPCDLGREPARIDDVVHDFLSFLDGGPWKWVAQMQVVHDDMHHAEPIAAIPCGVRVSGRWWRGDSQVRSITRSGTGFLTRANPA